MDAQLEYIPNEAQPLLLALADEAIQAGVLKRGDAGMDRVREVETAHESLAKSAGAFVTIYVGGELRGCLGQLQPSVSLAEVVADLAARVVHEDTRFPPVREVELGRLEFKISVLTPATRVEKLEEIEIGRDGLIVQKGRHRGVLLPEVPVEWGWDRGEFLVHLWRKAGLGSHVPWTETELFRFQSQLIDGRKH